MTSSGGSGTINAATKLSDKNEGAVKMTRLDYYWTTNDSWYHWEDGVMVVNNDAPPEAIESYNNYKKQLAEHYKKTESAKE